MSDSYPEYLNPFAEDIKPKTKVTLKNSFKELKRTLRQSFRIKKKDEEDVTYRQKTDTVRRYPVSYLSQQTEALPRSRFHERVSKYRKSADIPGSNPFEEEEESKTTVRRKGKKRAPLPPKSLSSQHINDETLEIPASGSHWSLTSVETDYSGSAADNASREEHENEIKKVSMLNTFIDFTKNMDQLKDDTNNNVVTKEEIVKETESNNNIPDLVVYCPSENHDVKQQTNVNKKDPSESEKEVNKSKQNMTEFIEKDITNKMIKEDNSNIKTEKSKTDEQTNENEPYLYHEKTSLYVSDSRDELNELETYTGRVSLYITGSCDDLDANNKSFDENVTDKSSKDESAPTPKQRKNKLTKNILLGM